VTQGIVLTTCIVALIGIAAIVQYSQRTDAATPPPPVPPAAAGEPFFVISPYLQMPTRESITVMWQTSVPGTSMVEYGVTQPFDLLVDRAELATIHEVPLVQLKPNTKYFYRVTSKLTDGKVLRSNVLTFSTAVDADSAFSFAVIGDTQKNPVVTGRIAKLMWERRPNFVMHVGDVVDNGPDNKEWVQELFRPCADLFSRVAIFPAIGNHERNHKHYYDYFALPAPEYFYRYSYGNADFFVLDTNKSVKPDSEQYKWLDAELAKSKARWKFCYHHHPAYTSDDDDYGNSWQNANTRQGDLNARSLVPLYEKYKVDVVFNGHIHVYERTWPIRNGKVDRANGVVYVTSGGGGGRLENFAPTPAWFKRQLRVDYHFCLVNIHGDLLEFKAFDQEGRLFDTFEIEKN
jgi:predicted phosphodiesterase